jgi:dihydrofolate synthase / folylpolyglutamate synthase
MDKLENWLRYLAKTRLYTFKTAASGEKDLSHARRIIDNLKLNPFPCPVITVTGTNGKGSCIATMEAVLIASGYKVAALTSPHLLHFTERLRMNGENISEVKLCEAFNFISEQEKQINAELSYYRFIHTAMIYLIAQSDLDVALFEIGLGGRSDSINLVDPSIAVVTSVALDHCEILGNTRALIAKEKSGIFRDNLPVVCGEDDGERLFGEVIKALHCDYRQLDQSFFLTEERDSWSFQSEAAQFSDLPYPKIFLRTAAVALQALLLLPSIFHFEANNIAQGMKNIRLLGRQDYLPSRPACLPACLLDVAHNPASVASLLNKIDELAVPGKKHAIFNLMQEKDMAAMLESMMSVVDDWYVPKIDHLRAKSAEEVVEYLLKQGKQARVCSSVETAYQEIKSIGNKADLIVAFGSFHVVAALYKVLL